MSRSISSNLNSAAKSIKQATTAAAKSVSDSAKQVAKSTTKVATRVATQTKDVYQGLRKETKQATANDKFDKFTTGFEGKDGALTGTLSRGFGDKMEPVTLKDHKTSNWTEAHSPTTKREKLKEAVKDAGNDVGVKVLEGELFKPIELNATSIKTKTVDQAKVEAKGFDVGYRVMTAYTSGKGEVRIGKKTNIEGKIEAGAVLAQGSVEGKVKLGKVDLTGKAEGTVGVTGTATGQLKFGVENGKLNAKVKAGVDVFVGAKVSAEGRIGNDYVGVGVKGEAMAGLALKAKVDAGIEGGRFKAKVELGAALGIGGSLSFSVDINYQKAVDKVVDVAKGAATKVYNTAKSVVNAAASVANTAKSAWNAVSSWF